MKWETEKERNHSKRIIEGMRHTRLRESRRNVLEEEERIERV